MSSIVRETFSELYKEILNNIYINPEYETSPRGLKIKEVTNVELILTDPTSNLFYNSKRSPKLRYLYPELMWYFSGKNDLEFISKYSKFWNKIANDNGTVNSAYGYLLFNQQNEYGYTEYQWAYESLKNDKDTRQAILRFNKPQHSYDGNKDFVCTLNGIFQIRDNKLKFTTTMRSQDVWFGIIYDIPFFTLLMQQMLKHLKPIYPELELGSYIHYVISEHLYEKNLQVVGEMLKHDFEPMSIPKLNDNLIRPDGSSTDLLLEAIDIVENFRNYSNNFKDDLIHKMIIYSMLEEPSE